METVLGFLVALGILHIQIGHVCSNSNGYLLEVAPSGIWSFITAFDINNKAKGTIRDNRSVPPLYNYNGRSVLVPYQALHVLPQYYNQEDSHIEDSHLNVRRSPEKRKPKPKTTTAKPANSELIPQSKKQTDPVAATKNVIKSENGDLFLADYAHDLNIVAYNTAKYVQLSATVVFEHIKCAFDIFKMIVKHVLHSTKQLLQSPIQLLFLPFTLPVQVVKFMRETLNFFKSFTQHLFFNN